VSAGAIRYHDAAPSVLTLYEPTVDGVFARLRRVASVAGDLVGIVFCFPFVILAIGISIARSAAQESRNMMRFWNHPAQSMSESIQEASGPPHSSSLRSAVSSGRGPSVVAAGEYPLIRAPRPPLSAHT
jgi:hypothetical protein